MPDVGITDNMILSQIGFVACLLFNPLTGGHVLRRLATDRQPCLKMRQLPLSVVCCQLNKINCFNKTYSNGSA